MISIKSILVALVVASVAVQEAVAYREYLSVIPGSTTETGHPRGDTSQLTDLAKAFESNGKKWDKTICEKYGAGAGLSCDGVQGGSGTSTSTEVDPPSTFEGSILAGGSIESPVSTENPSTAIPLTVIPSTAIPLTVIPSRAIPLTVIPSRAIPLTVIPSTAIPLKVIPLKVIPLKVIPSTVIPSTEIPAAQNPSAEIPSAQNPSAQKPSAQKKSAQSPQKHKQSARKQCRKKPKKSMRGVKLNKPCDRKK
jgi:hypothetical protein